MLAETLVQLLATAIDRAGIGPSRNALQKGCHRVPGPSAPPLLVFVHDDYAELSRYCFATTPMLAIVAPLVIDGTAHTYRTMPAVDARASKIVLPT